MPFLIDGHNLLYAARNSSDQFQNMNAEVLCKVLAAYFALGKQKAELVFDGTGPMDKRFFDNFSNPRICFSGADREADDIIEQRVADCTAPKRLIVVSSDRRVRDAVRRRRAMEVMSEDFWITVVAELEKPRRVIYEPDAKYRGVSKAETDLWLKFFDF